MGIHVSNEKMFQTEDSQFLINKKSKERFNKESS